MCLEKWSADYKGAEYVNEFDKKNAADEMALYWHGNPKRTLSMKVEEQSTGFKQYNARVIALPIPTDVSSK